MIAVGERATTSRKGSKLEQLESIVEKGQRESIAALREIRENKLFKENYKTFDEYMSQRWNRTRQWATHQIAWLRRQELLEEIAGDQFGKPPYQLTVAEADVLKALEPEAETIRGCEEDDEQSEPDLSRLFVDAALEAQAEAERLGTKRTVKMMKSAVQKRTALIENREAIAEDLTLQESEELNRLDGTNDVSAKRLLKTARSQARKNGGEPESHLAKLIKAELEKEAEPSSTLRLVEMDEYDESDGDAVNGSQEMFYLTLSGHFDGEAGVPQSCSKDAIEEVLKKLLICLDSQAFCSGTIEIRKAEVNRA